MSGPHNLPEAEHQRSQTNRRSNQGSDQRDFQRFHGSSSITGYEEKSSFVPLKPLVRATASSVTPLLSQISRAGIGERSV
jgi:hypothetical protein